MAHSILASFDEEIDGFQLFAETLFENTILLIDTYDALAGAQEAAILVQEMSRQEERLKTVRLDGGGHPYAGKPGRS